MRILTTYFNKWLQCKYIWSTLNFNHFGAFEEKGPLNLIYNFFIGFSSYGILSQRVKKQIRMLLMYLLFVLKGMRSKYIGHIICYTMVHKGSNCQICPKFRACYHQPPPPSHIPDISSFPMVYDRWCCFLVEGWHKFWSLCCYSTSLNTDISFPMTVI